MKAYKGLGMDGWIARWYARTREHDLADFREQAGMVASRLSPGAKVLEVAPGPGFFSIELARLGQFTITGLDVSATFVEIATDNAKRAGVNVLFRLGNASAMPFPDDSFDLVYCSAAFKNFAEPVEALNEMYRVLHPGGQAIIHDLRKDVSPAEIDAYLKESGRRALDAWLTRWTFRTMLIKRAYTKQELIDMAVRSRFHSADVTNSSIGVEVRLLRQLVQ
ncbi:MAG TPA: class I SAM-dependent methyltransferase [Gemmatimonadaceae bacterium]|nr:class I SAM-dependent methyltransferase [Gemmatimonadaceae bacterium]